ncbi:hypothetical protein G6F46_015518 [Rhizopus delemar]|nr:hypothetical protein G6F24_016760 [Rhizopus arrhizus]KAG1580416.1 hypothetical protein G6F46_015518 [Rhizopus delemar]
MLQAECLESRGVDQVATRRRQVIQPRAGRGVLAHVEGGGVFSRGGAGGGDQRIEQRGFAHAALTQQQVGAAGQVRPAGPGGICYAYAV